jgi:hypothetical protein
VKTSFCRLPPEKGFVFSSSYNVIFYNDGIPFPWKSI